MTSGAFQTSRSSMRGPAWAATPRAAVIWGLVAVAVIAFAGWSVVRYFESINTLTRGPITSSLQVTAAPGEVVVYYEGGYDRSLADLGLSVTGPDGKAVALTGVGYDLRYDIDRLVGHAIATFQAPVAGSYTVTSSLSELGARIAAGTNIGPISLVMIAAGISSIFAIGIALLVTIAFALARRRPR